MMGWRARIGFLVPPGNPTVEPEMMELAPPGVSVHFTRMSASGATGTHEGQEERNRTQVASVDEAARLLAMTGPRVIVLAHTATSYTLGRDAEVDLIRRQEDASGTRFVTAFGSVLAALSFLGVRRIAYATPYAADLTEKGRAHLELHGFDVVGVARLEGVKNIYEETIERAYSVGRQADRPDAEAVFLSGTGMPTLGMLQVLEWHALRVAGVKAPRAGYGRLLAGV
jgi:maleate cis-trans isomerase